MQSLKLLSVVFATLVALTLGVAAGITGSHAEHPCVSPGLFGDTDGNRTVTSADALITLRTVAGFYVHSPCGPYDVDCDHDANAVDALKILRFVAGSTYSQVDPCPNIGIIVPGGQ